MAKRNKPNILQGIAGFGTSYLMGTADGWSKLKKSEKDEFGGSFWNYMKRDRDGTQKPTTGNFAPVETPSGQSNPQVPAQTDSAASSTFGAESSQDKSFIDSGSESTTEIPSPVPDQPAMSESSLPDDAAYEEEMRRMQQQAQQEYSNSFNDFSSGDSNGS